MKTIHLIVMMFAVAPCIALSGFARPEMQWVLPMSLAAGPLSNVTGQPEVKVIGVVVAPAAARVRAVVSEVKLGAGSKVRFVSVKDGQSQTLDAAQLAIWSSTSALFNGDRIQVEIIVAPGDTGVAVRVKELLAFSVHTDGSRTAEFCCGGRGPETLCGPDDRVASNDNRVGRLSGGCTGWLTANGAVLTAGHCGIVGGSILEVNIPASQPNGSTVASAVRDQFPVIAGSVTTSNNGVGNDWTVCRIGPNNLGQFAHQLYGFFRMAREVPGAGFGLIVTGCGIDNSPQGSQPMVCGNFDGAGNCTHFGLNAQSQTLQTARGFFVGEIAGEFVSSLSYSVDTEPANSGSPVIWEANGFTIGIHTAGGCSSGGGSNAGTSFELDALENVIAGVPGPNCRYLDRVKAPSGAENGTVFQPHDTLVEARDATPTGGILSIVAGSYPVPAGGVIVNRAMTLSAPVGAVILGN